MRVTIPVVAVITLLWIAWLRASAAVAGLNALRAANALALAAAAAAASATLVARRAAASATLVASVVRRSSLGSFLATLNDPSDERRTIHLVGGRSDKYDLVAHLLVVGGGIGGVVLDVLWFLFTKRQMA
jgi:hypothetical protein